MVSVRDWRRGEEWGLLLFGQQGQCYPEEDCEDRHLKYLVLRDGEREVLREHVQEE